MSLKREAAEDVQAVVPQHLSDMAKATLPEPQGPAEESHSRRVHASVPTPPGAANYLSVGGRSCPVGDGKRSH